MDIIVFHIAVFHQFPNILRIVVIGIVGIRISYTDSASRYIIEPVSSNGAVLYALHHLQSRNPQSGKAASQKADRICPFHSDSRIRQPVGKTMFPNMVILRIRVPIFGTGTVPCSIRKRNTDKLDILHHVIVIGSLNTH